MRQRTIRDAARRRRRASLAALILTAVIATGVADPASAPARTIDDTADAVQKHVAAGAWREAVRDLRAAADVCIGAPDSTSCRARLLFTWGYVYQSWAVADNMRRADLLRRSAHAYAAARELAPASEQIWLNECVVHKDLGDWEFLRRSLGEAARLWPQRRVHHLVMYGDLFAGDGRFGPARRYLAMALELAPGDEAALRSLIAVQRMDTSVTAASLLAQGQSRSSFQ